VIGDAHEKAVRARAELDAARVNLAAAKAAGGERGAAAARVLERQVQQLETRVNQAEAARAAARRSLGQVEQRVDAMRSALRGTTVAVRGPDGRPQTLTLRDYKGQGLYNVVFTTDDPKRVVKLTVNPELSREQILESARGVVHGANYLLDPPVPTSAPPIPHKRVLMADTDGALPYTITEALDPASEWQIPKSGRHYTRPLSRDEQVAVLELYQNLSRQGLVWADGHLDNIYFFKDGGGVRAGILDTDRIGHLPSRPGVPLAPGDEALVRWRDSYAQLPQQYNIHSLLPDPTNVDRLTDPSVFMAKMLEHKALIRFDPGTGSYGPGFIDDLDLVRKFFNIDGPPGVSGLVPGPGAFQDRRMRAWSFALLSERPNRIEEVRLWR
jgi:hypothetical protein